MKIGKRKYEIKNSDCWLVFPSTTLTVNVWTADEKTYLITEPIRLIKPQNLIIFKFKSDFLVEGIDDIDTTLLENGKAVEIWNQEIIFDDQRLFELKKVTITGRTINDDIVEVDTETTFLGFEIWKMDNYEIQVTEIENILQDISIPFETHDESENDLIRILILTEPKKT